MIIEITNLTPRSISLPYKDDLISVEIHPLEHATIKPYRGPYQDKLELGPEEIEAVTESEGMALSEVLTTLRSLSQNVAALASEVRTLQWAVPLIVTLGFTIIGIIVVIK